MNRNIEIRQLNHDEKRLFRDVLLTYFPALQTDEEINGADAVDALVEIYEMLKE